MSPFPSERAALFSGSDKVARDRFRPRLAEAALAVFECVEVLCAGGGPTCSGHDCPSLHRCLPVSSTQLTPMIDFSAGCRRIVFGYRVGNMAFKANDCADRFETHRAFVPLNCEGYLTRQYVHAYRTFGVTGFQHRRRRWRTTFRRVKGWQLVVTRCGTLTGRCRRLASACTVNLGRSGEGNAIGQ